MALNNSINLAKSVISQLNVAETRSASLDLNFNELRRPLITNYSEKTQTVAATTSTTLTIADGNVIILTQDTNITTLSFVTAVASGQTAAFTLQRVKDNSGTGRSIIWPASVRWANGSAPNLTQSANAVDIFVFYTTDGGTTWRGFPAAIDSR